jgi:flagellar biosynthesis protein FliP
MRRLNNFFVALSVVLMIMGAVDAWAIPMPNVTLGFEEADSPQQVASIIQIVIIMTVLTLAPTILVITTAFIRILVVFSFVRQAMGTQNMPPNQILVSLALFLTFYIMSPVYNQIQEKAYRPYMANQITQAQALDIAAKPLKEFMFKNTREKDLALFVKIAQKDRPATRDDIPLATLIPAFVVSELKTAFTIGFILYVPFLVIDMVVASVLLSMGMMMLPPVMISLPFKLMLFVLVDGWNLLVGSLVKSFG